MFSRTAPAGGGARREQGEQGAHQGPRRRGHQRRGSAGRGRTRTDRRRDNRPGWRSEHPRTAQRSGSRSSRSGAREREHGEPFASGLPLFCLQDNTIIAPQCAKGVQKMWQRCAKTTRAVRKTRQAQRARPAPREGQQRARPAPREGQQREAHQREARQRPEPQPGNQARFRSGSAMPAGYAQLRVLSGVGGRGCYYRAGSAWSGGGAGGWGAGFCKMLKSLPCFFNKMEGFFPIQKPACLLASALPWKAWCRC